MIPNELTQLPQWVCWRYENDGAGKPTKVPFQALTGDKASSTNPATWCDYASALAACSHGWYAGVGFVLTEANNMTLLDLDDPGGDPVIAERHNKLIKMMNSYTEWSPSGKGMHIIVRGRVQAGTHRHHLGMFSTARYMTMTGNTVYDAPIEERQAELDFVQQDIQQYDTSIIVREAPAKHSEYDIYTRMMNASNGDKILSTWNGDWQGMYASHSECDQALINYLQFYTQNVDQITRMFLASPCARRLTSGVKHKWPKYIPNMIKKAFDRQLPELDINALTVRASAQLAANANTLTIAAPPPVEPISWPEGLVGAVAKFIYDQAPLPVPEVALAGALTFMAGICGRAFNVSGEGLNLYLLVLAPTGVGKEAAARGITKLMEKIVEQIPAAVEYRGPAEIASGPALTKALAKNLCCFSILGEFGMRLNEMCSEHAQSHMVGLRRVLLDLFHKSGAGNQLLQHVYSDKDKNTGVLQSPAYTIMGESTPETFYRHLDESMISDGLLPRFIVIEYAGDRPPLNRDFALVQPDQYVVDFAVRLVNYCITIQQKNRALNVQLTEDAQAMSWKYSDDITKRINQAGDAEISRQLLNRAHIKMLKLAALIAVGCNPNVPVITISMLEWARRLVERDMSNILNRFASGSVGTETSEFNQQQDLLKALAMYTSKPITPAMLRIMPGLEKMRAANVIPYQVIQRQCGQRASFKRDRIGSTNAIQRTIQTFINMGKLLEVKQSTLFDNFQTTSKAYAILDINEL